MPNKDFWKLVAENLGVELEEEFKVKGLDMPFKVTQEGIRLYMNSEWVQPVPELELGILHKTLPLISKPWKPKRNEEYYYIVLGNEFSIAPAIWLNFAVDNQRYRGHNCFQTEKEAKGKLKEILKVLEGDNK